MTRRGPKARDREAALSVGLRIVGPRFGVWFAVGANDEVVLVIDGTGAGWRQFRRDCALALADEQEDPGSP